MNNDEMRKRVKQYLDDTAVAKSKFCDKVSLGRTTLYRWLMGEIILSNTKLTNIDNYLKEFDH